MTKDIVPASEVPTVWTRFSDSHSGGGTKTDFEYVIIQAPEVIAVAVFEHVFGFSPDNTTCPTCGPDFSYYEETGTLAEVAEHTYGNVLVLRPDQFTTKLH